LEEEDRILLYRDLDGTVHDIEKPPTSKLDFREVSRHLGLPGYLEPFCSPLQRAVFTIWVASNSSSLMSGHPDAKKVGGPLNPLLMGGAAVKLLCPSANEPMGPMNRKLKDLDYVVKKEQGSRFIVLLANMSGFAGSKYHHFLTSGDRRFNAIRAGDRYRIRSVDWTEDMQPIVNWVDVLVEKVEMRHVVDVRDEFSKDPKLNHHTIGVENLLLTKCQMIMEIESKEHDALVQSGQEFRILKCPWYRKNRFVIGMEEKDMLDTCALLHDHFIQDSSVKVEKIKAMISKDQKFTLTFRLNIENILERFEFLRSKGMSERQLSRVAEAAHGILGALPDSKKRWDKPWWNTDVDTPTVA